MLAGPQSSSHHNAGTGPGGSSSSAAARSGINGVSTATNPSSGFDPQSFRTGFTPDLSNFRTGLTPLAGGPTSFPPPSPNTAAFLAMVTNGPGAVVPATTGPTITPNTLAALTGAAPNPAGPTSINGMPGHGDGSGPNGPNMAANGLFLLSQAQQMEMAKQDDPEAAAAAEALQGVSQIFAGPGQPGGPAPDPSWPGAIPGPPAGAALHHHHQQQQHQQQQQQQQQQHHLDPSAAAAAVPNGHALPNGNTPKKGGGAGAKAGAGKRKSSAGGSKGGPNGKNGAPALPVAKRAKTTANASMSAAAAAASSSANDPPRANHNRRTSTSTSLLNGNGSSDGGMGEFDFKNMPDFDDDDDDDDGGEGEDDGKGGKKKGGRRGNK
ncbi:Transcription factor, partial [Tilletia horrida]